jgi:DNA-binding Xre family transcriptional regulator
MNQVRLGELIGLDRSYVSKIESNTRDVDLAILERMAKALECEPVDLLIRDPKDPEGIWGVWDRMDDHVRSQLIAIAKTLLPPDGKK